jgi:hypothetical protein
MAALLQSNLLDVSRRFGLSSALVLAYDRQNRLWFFGYRQIRQKGASAPSALLQWFRQTKKT